MTAPLTDLRGALAPLVRRLRRQRRAADLMAVGAGLTVGAAVGMALTRTGLVWPVDPAAVFAIGIATGVGTVRAIVHARSPLTPFAAARRAERDPMWRERLTTALEHGARPGIVPEALLADAIAHAASLDTRRIAPWRWEWRTLTILVVGTLAAGALVALPTSMVLPFDASGSSDRAPAPTATAVSDLARRVAADARRSRDAYLAALAEQLQALADEAGAGPLDAAARAQLGAVLEALAAASNGAITTERLQADLIAREAALADESEGNLDGGTSRTTTERTGSPAEPGRAPNVDDGVAQAQDFEETVHPGASGGGGSSQTGPPGEGEFDPSLLDEVRAATRAEGPPPVGTPGELIGAAEEAGAGDSRLAGRGSQALEGAAGEADFADAGAEAIALSGSERDQGRRIEVELPPAEEWEGYDPTLFAIGAWRATPESPVTTDPIPLRYREAAGRYFLPSQETAASR